MKLTPSCVSSFDSWSPTWAWSKIESYKVQTLPKRELSVWKSTSSSSDWTDKNVFQVSRHIAALKLKYLEANNASNTR